MAKKKGDQLRFCCDFRYLNSVTVKDAYPIPRIDASHDYVSTIDGTRIDRCNKEKRQPGNVLRG